MRTLISLSLLLLVLLTPAKVSSQEWIGAVHREVNDTVIIKSLNRLDTVSVYMDNDVLHFFPCDCRLPNPDVKHPVQNEYRVVSEEAEHFEIVVNWRTAQSFLMWVLLLPPTEEDIYNLDFYYFNILKEKLWE